AGKSEVRSPKSETNRNHPTPKSETKPRASDAWLGPCLEHSASFGIRACFGFRASDLSLRVCLHVLGHLLLELGDHLADRLGVLQRLAVGVAVAVERGDQLAQLHRESVEHRQQLAEGVLVARPLARLD